MDRWFHPTHSWECDYLSMLGFKLIHVSKSGPRVVRWNIYPYHPHVISIHRSHAVLLLDIAIYITCLSQTPKPQSQATWQTRNSYRNMEIRAQRKTDMAGYFCFAANMTSVLEKINIWDSDKRCHGYTVYPIYYTQILLCFVLLRLYNHTGYSRESIHSFSLELLYWH